MPRHWPTIGHIRWYERLAGWRDIRCATCGTVGGAGTKGTEHTIVACRLCPESDWFRSLPRQPA